MDIRIVTHGSSDYEQIKQLRQEVMRAPLGLMLSEKDVEGEEYQILIGAFENEKILGCVIFKPLEGGNIKLRQMAVSSAAQGRGLGRKIVRFGEDYARSHRFTSIELAARMSAQLFYEKLGYTVTGEPYTEIGLPHINMIKTL